MTNLLEGPRWSTTSRTCCPRAALYGSLATAEETDDPWLQDHFELGNAICNHYRAKDVGELEAEGHTCTIEMPIPWPKTNPVGTGHADLVVDGTRGRLVVEYTSNDDGDLADSKLRQAIGYAINADADAVCIVRIAIGPKRKGRVYRDSFTLSEYPELVAEVLALEAAAAEAVRAGEAERVCQHPGDGRGRLCPHVGVCFADWQPTPLDELIGLDQDLKRLAAIKDELGELEDKAEPLKIEQAEIAARVRQYLDEGEQVIGARTSDGGGVVAKRIVTRRTTFSKTKADKLVPGWCTGRLVEALTTSESEQLDIRRIGGA